MIVTFTPVEGEKRTWEFRADKIMQPEAELIERRTGMTYDQFTQAIVQGSALARRALVFVFEKRVHPTLSWDAFGDFPVTAIQVDYDRDEMAEILKQVRESPGLTDEERAGVVAALEAAALEAPEPPKAPEPNVEVST